MQSSGGRFLTDGDNVALHLDGLDFDVARFEMMAAGSAPEYLEQALVVYRGDLLDGFGLKEEPFEDCRIERERLRAMAVARWTSCRALQRDERSGLVRARGNPPAGNGAAEGGIHRALRTARPRAGSTRAQAI